MRNLYHLCVASHNEVLFRDESDFLAFTNLMALAAYKTNEELLADALMSTHYHLAVMSHDPAPFISSLRHSYGRYFNYKYNRTGRLGPKGFFQTRIDGMKHRNAALSYILRNGLHHAQSPTPFGYRHCTINSVFNKEMGRSKERHLITSRSEIATYLPRHAVFPDHYVMNEDGVFLRESFMEIPQLELLFVTPRGFLYQMNRLSDEVWQKEQLEENPNEPPVTLNTIERPFDKKSVLSMLECEKGFKYDASKMNDVAVCNIIDNQLIRRYKKASVYALDETQKNKIAQVLKNDFRIPQYQINRCLVCGRLG